MSGDPAPRRLGHGACLAAQSLLLAGAALVCNCTAVPLERATHSATLEVGNLVCSCLPTSAYKKVKSDLPVVRALNYLKSSLATSRGGGRGGGTLKLSFRSPLKNIVLSPATPLKHVVLRSATPLKFDFVCF